MKIHSVFVFVFLPAQIWRTFLLLTAAVALLFSGNIHAAVPRDFAVDLKTTVSDTSPRITLGWTQRIQANITSQKIHRRLKGASTWTLLANLTTTQTSYADTTAALGVEYEYWMERRYSGTTPALAMGYLSAGVKVPEVHSRGKLLLVIDNTMITPLAPEIAQLQLDLAADGWTVQQIIAPRTGTAASTRALIKAAYDADPTNVRAVYLLGHVPVPYSGDQFPDGHPDHRGAWPSDTYYAEMDGLWTDTVANNTTAARSQNDNVPGDGKFDQSRFNEVLFPAPSDPTPLELEVGRVDLHTMTKAPTSAVTETSLLRRYLQKAHSYRHKIGAYAAIPRRSLIRDGFGHLNSTEPFAVTGWAGAFTNVGQAPEAPIDEAPNGQWFSNTYAGGQSYLWGHGNGGGSYESASTLGTSTDFGQLPNRVVFMSVFGSYHGDWDSDNNLMRAIIAGAPADSLSLCCYWTGRPNWFVHSLGMGETLGYMTRSSLNGTYDPINGDRRPVYLGLMGDPALRIHAVEPPRGLSATSSSGQVTLDWTASTESNLQGYHVYRGIGAAGPFTKLTSTPQTGTTFTDTGAAAGQAYTYLVRTLKLEGAPGGTYYNLSVGSPVSITAQSEAIAAPSSAADLRLAVQGPPTQAMLTWMDRSNNETGFRIERKTGAAGSFTTLATLGANTTSYSDAGPFSAGSVYFYRVIATGTPDAVASNEASFEPVAGFVKLTTAARMKVSKANRVAIIPIERFGGGLGAVGLNYATANSSAVAGTHFTATSGTLSWADGEMGIKHIIIPLLDNGQPQLPRQFKLTLTSPTGGLSIAGASNVTLLIEDPTATLPAPWQTAVIGSLTDHSPGAFSAGEFGDATIGGSGLTSAAVAEAGRFTYQTFTGDGVLTAFVPQSVPQQSGAYFALMARASTATGAIHASCVIANPGANFGARLSSRSGNSSGNIVTPSTDNNLDTPSWIRLRRAGNLFTAESSPDGVNWSTIGSVTLSSMPATAEWGLFHRSDNGSDFQTGIFQNVSLQTSATPPAPSGFSTGTPSAAQVPLSWSTSLGATGYRIERRSESGSFAQIADIPSAYITNYQDGGLLPNNGYEYRILAYNSTGNSAWSATIRAGTRPASTVTLLTTDASGGGDATIASVTPTVNNGTVTSLAVSGSDVSNGAITPVTKAWLRFNLAGISQIISARLKLAFVGEQNTQAGFLAGYPFTMQASLLTESADGWLENTVTWNNAIQNNTTGIGVSASATSLGSYFLPNFAALPAPSSIINIELSGTGIQSSRGANNLITIALHPGGRGGALMWAAREHATLAPPTLEVTSTPPQPSRPTFFTATPGAGTNIVLTWNDSSNNETGFVIERRPLNGTFATLQNMPANATTFTDISVFPGVTYEYRMRATNAAGTSSDTPIAAATVMGTASAYRLWLQTHGLPMDGSGTGAPENVLANDGLSNLLKFSLGLNPSIPGNQGRMTQNIVDFSGSKYLSFSYTRPEPAPTGITYIVEAKQNLANAPDWSSAGLTQISSVVNGAFRTITFRGNLPTPPGPSQFARLRVTQP